MTRTLVKLGGLVVAAAVSGAVTCTAHVPPGARAKAESMGAAGSQDCSALRAAELESIPRAAEKTDGTGAAAAHTPAPVKDEIDSLLKLYLWDDSGVVVSFCPDNIVPLPAVQGTRWTDSVIHAFVKGPQGCFAATLRRSDSGLRGYFVSETDTLGDTVTVTTHHFIVDTKFAIAGTQSCGVTLQGDTIYGGGRDDFVDGGAVTGVNDDAMEFGGEVVGLEAQCAHVDTIRRETRGGSAAWCLQCRGIQVLARGADMAYSFETDFAGCHGRMCEGNQVGAAIFLINSYLRKQRFVLKADIGDYKLFRRLDDCLLDRQVGGP